MFYVWLHRHMTTCTNINIYADERIADAGPPHTRARVLRPSARARARAIGRPRIRADACERLPAGVDRGGSARRRSTTRRGSTRTSARGTPPPSPRCPMYAPPFPARAVRHRRRDARGGVVDAARAVVRGGTAAAPPRMHTCVRFARITCIYIHTYIYICIYIYIYIYISIYMCVCVLCMYA
jgi:hypothetical protein